MLFVVRLLADLDDLFCDLCVVDVSEGELLGDLLREEELLQFEDVVKYTHC